MQCRLLPVAVLTLQLLEREEPTMSSAHEQDEDMHVQMYEEEPSSSHAVPPWLEHQ